MTYRVFALTPVDILNAFYRPIYPTVFLFRSNNWWNYNIFPSSFLPLSMGKGVGCWCDALLSLKKDDSDDKMQMTDLINSASSEKDVTVTLLMTFSCLLWITNLDCFIEIQSRIPIRKGYLYACISVAHKCIHNFRVVQLF